MSTENSDELASGNRGLPPPSFIALLDQKTQTLYKIITLLLKVYPVLILILGSFGNLLSFCVLIRSAMRRYSTFCYLACLALVDLGVIITFCVNFIFLYHFTYDIQDQPYLCKLFAFSIYFLPQYSSWILVAVSIDRVISAKYLRLAKTWSKPKHSVLVTFLLGLFLALLNSHFFLYDNTLAKERDVQQTNIYNKGQQQQQPEPSQYTIYNNTILKNFPEPNTLIDEHQFREFSFMNSYAISGSGSDSSLAYEPFTLVSIETFSRETTIQNDARNSILKRDNLMREIDVNVIHCSPENSHKYENLYRYWVWIDLAMNVFIPFTAMIACTIIIILTLIRSSTRAGSTSARRSRRRRNISVMLITINLAFISLTAPIVVFLSIHEYVKTKVNFYRNAILILIKILCIILMNVNHSFNIVVYSVTAKEFRSEMSNFLHSFLYCIVGRPTNLNDLPYIRDDGTLLSRLRRFRRNLFKCCRLKMGSNSTNTTDSSGLQQTAVPAGMNPNRSVGSNQMYKRKRLERNANRKYSFVSNNEMSRQTNVHLLAVQSPSDLASSIYEREDISCYGLSISTED